MYWQKGKIINTNVQTPYVQTALCVENLRKHLCVCVVFFFLSYPLPHIVYVHPQDILYVWSEPKLCMGGVTLPEKKTLPCEDVEFWVRLGAGLAAFTAGLLVSLTCYFWKKNKRYCFHFLSFFFLCPLFYVCYPCSTFLDPHGLPFIFLHSLMSLNIIFFTLLLFLLFFFILKLNQFTLSCLYPCILFYLFVFLYSG